MKPAHRPQRRTPGRSPAYLAGRGTIAVVLAASLAVATNPTTADASSTVRSQSVEVDDATRPTLAEVDPFATTSTTTPGSGANGSGSQIPFPDTTVPAPARPVRPPRPAVPPVIGPVDGSGRDTTGRVVAISPALGAVPAHSTESEDLDSLHEQETTRLADAWNRSASTQQLLAEATADHAALEDLLERNRRRSGKYHKFEQRWAEARRELAVRSYTGDRLGELLSVLSETTEEGFERLLQQGLTERATSIVNAGVETMDARRSALDDKLERLSSDLDESAEVGEAQAAALGVAQSDAERLTVTIADLDERIAAQRPNSIVDGSDLPLLALDAYWRAANSLATSAPACRLGWWALAGVGRTESNHGRFGGAHLRPDGSVSIEIIGIALDGTNNTRAIGDSEGGTLDGDSTWDRAVGPMQFIPTTWKRYGADGSLDGVSDPQNLYDAALAAGRLLCSVGVSLDNAEGLRRAFRRYNNSGSYVETVLSRSIAYGELPVPVGFGAPPIPPLAEVVEPTAVSPFVVPAN